MNRPSTATEGCGRTQRPHPVDLHIASRLRLRRSMLGMSQQTLADATRIPLNQLQKYERGRSRISARRLYELSSALDVPVSFFFDDQTGQVWPLSNASAQSSTTPGPAPPDLHLALSLLLAVVDLADREGGIDDRHYQAARESARELLARLSHA